MKFTTLAIAAMGAMLALAPANAAFYVLNYTATDGSPLPTTAFIRIQTSDVANGDGGFNILKASGSYTTGETTTQITGLAPVNPPGFSTDNVFYTTDPAFTERGLGVLIAGGDANLWGTGPGAYTFYEYKGGGYSIATTGTLTVSPGTGVPEPGVWALLLTGFGLVGFASRRRSAAVAA